jgi:predicted Zn-dependent protease
MMWLRHRGWPLTVVLLGVGTFTACTAGGIHRWHPNWYSLNQDIAVGRRLAKQVEEEVSLLRHTMLTQLLDGIGERLLANPPHPAFRNFPYAFKAVDSPEINAFALPGGPIYVNSGIITLLETQDQLASVLAHEMSHVAARHATEMLTTLQASNLFLLVTFSGIPVVVPPLALEGTRLAYLLSMLRYNRSKEEEADELGLHLMWNAGYDPREMAVVFRRFDEERQALPTLLEALLSSHPLSSDRVHEAETRAEALGPPPEPADASSRVLYGQVRAMFAKD